MTNTTNRDVSLFIENVDEFYNKAITCNLKSIVKDVRYLESLANRIRANLSNLKENQKTDFINSNSKYISAEYIIDECTCTRKNKGVKLIKRNYGRYKKTFK